MKILLATNDATFNVSLAAAYRSTRHELHVGTAELALKQAEFDTIHLHWPEELVAWTTPPNPHFARHALELLDWWRERSQLVCTVHNLVPHASGPHDEASRHFYGQFYARMHRIGHFSHSSLEAVKAKYPESRTAEHVVHGMNLFEDLRQHSVGRAAARSALGIAEGTFAVATLGAIRSWRELALLAAATSRTGIRNLRVLHRARGGISSHPLKRFVQNLQLRRWRSRAQVDSAPGFLTDAQMTHLVEAADAVFVPRLKNELNSGIPPLAMTFGTPIVAPDCGVFRETLLREANGLYAVGDPGEAARELERVARMDAAGARSANLAHTAGWGWASAIHRLIPGL